jgi:hypothetical protein
MPNEAQQVFHTCSFFKSPNNVRKDWSRGPSEPESHRVCNSVFGSNKNNAAPAPEISLELNLKLTALAHYSPVS